MATKMGASLKLTILNHAGQIWTSHGGWWHCFCLYADTISNL
jgi:hypothetical protein